MRARARDRRRDGRRSSRDAGRPSGGAGRRPSRRGQPRRTRPARSCRRRAPRARRSTARGRPRGRWRRRTSSASRSSRRRTCSAGPPSDPRGRPGRGRRPAGPSLADRLVADRCCRGRPARDPATSEQRGHDARVDEPGREADPRKAARGREALVLGARSPAPELEGVQRLRHEPQELGLAGRRVADAASFSRSSSPRARPHAPRAGSGPRAGRTARRTNWSTIGKNSSPSVNRRIGSGGGAARDRTASFMSRHRPPRSASWTSRWFR